MTVLCVTGVRRVYRSGEPTVRALAALAEPPAAETAADVIP